MPGTWSIVENIHQERRSAAVVENSRNHGNTISDSLLQPASESSTTRTFAAVKSGSSTANNADDTIQKYVALGCLHLDRNVDIRFDRGHVIEQDWHELLYPDLSDEVKLILGIQASKLVAARWIRLFIHQSNAKVNRSLIRVYLMPEDWGRRTIDRNSKSLKAALRQLLQQVDISTVSWNGHPSDLGPQRFDPWAGAELFSLYYLFNKLPSPAPTPETIKNRYARAAVYDIIESAASSEYEKDGQQPLAGLRSRLYPYQARSASLMIQREASPQLQLDPRLEVRTAPNGDIFYFGARDGLFLQEPRYYETNRGGILAETMGLGKTIICLAVILATKHHLPQIPAAYHPPASVRSRVGTLSNMAASIIGRYSIPARAFLEQSEANNAGGMSNLRHVLDYNTPFYEIPPNLPRMSRNTRTPPSRQLVTCSGTIIVVPRNLLHQWQSEIKKHVLSGGLKVLVVDSVSKMGSQTKVHSQIEEVMEFASELPTPSELMKFDVVLFTRHSFEREIQDGSDEHGRRALFGITRECTCPYTGATRVPDCNCYIYGKVYESPLKALHWLRIIIDEGHSFSSSVSNAVLVAKQIQAERRWVVSGTPAKSLVGVEVDTSTLNNDSDNITLLRESVIEQRKAFSLDNENTKATKALGSLASHFLMVRPWCDSTIETKLDWDEYVYRHEHHYRKTYSGFSSCFLRTLEGLVVKTRPEDVDKDIVLPPMRHRIVYLKPCWFDKMTANLFIQVLRANAVTSERTDVDYLFHKNSAKARHSLIRNLRQSNFTWTGFSLSDVISTIETSEKYLAKEDKSCSREDADLLFESSHVISKLATSQAWIALSTAHEVGMAIHTWPQAYEQDFSLTYPAKPTMVGITQLLEGQLHVDSNILSQDPTTGLDIVGQTVRAKISAMAEAEDKGKFDVERMSADSQLQKSGVPSSCIGGQQSLTSRRASAMTGKLFTQKGVMAEAPGSPQDSMNPPSPVRPRKRKLTLADETASLASNSPLLNTRVIGTTSAKLTYLVEKVMQHQATEKIIIFYEGDNAAYYIAQCLEMLYVNHRIYARTLDNNKRSEYVKLFNEDLDVRVLLIDVACGALGLNLNVASVVLIVNPVNRPDLEAQAIKRAHRIGQTREVLVETLILENTIEHAIFDRAKKMSRADHQEAKELEDDAGIVEIIQNAQIFPVQEGEDEGLASFALLKTPQQVFGRPDRHKYHRFGATETKTDKPQKKVKVSKNVKESSVEDGGRLSKAGVPGSIGQPLTLPLHGLATQDDVPTSATHVPGQISSIFGNA